MGLSVLDTTMLTLLMKPSAVPPHDPATGQPVTRAKDRVEFLIETLSSDASARILVPATVWAEFLVPQEEAAQEYLEKIRELANFEIVPFDAVAAAEAAMDQRKALRSGNRQLDLHGSRQCIKADRQIMAIAKVRQVDMVYAADTDFERIGQSMNVPVTLLWQLPLKPSSTPLLDTADQQPEPPQGQ